MIGKAVVIGFSPELSTQSPCVGQFDLGKKAREELKLDIHDFVGSLSGPEVAFLFEKGFDYPDRSTQYLNDVLRFNDERFNQSK
ncbi:hypothetical protein [Sulfoacidibacillus ferrooxidans]|uniref:Uncharacterized protein n=1 Tax=Sulfoacidibacillus ferrooxidans TaxID=2005001 RepID=A0A9X1VET0_9BACL|nr:hypothetical protein [Sulfoacidibacillus ferrooxidans]MCI0184798.1 hypothetical protein [Sulfoacidibacillus ferrooxidans]